MLKKINSIIWAVVVLAFVVMLIVVFRGKPDTLPDNVKVERLRHEKDSIYRLYDSLKRAYSINELDYYVEIRSKNETIRELQKTVLHYDTLLHRISFIPECAILDSIARYYSRQDGHGSE